MTISTFTYENVVSKKLQNDLKAFEGLTETLISLLCRPAVEFLFCLLKIKTGIKISKFTYDIDQM